MRLRPYQSEAVAKTLEAFEENQSALVVMPTGCVSAETIIGVNRAKKGYSRKIANEFMAQFDPRRIPGIATHVRALIGTRVGLHEAKSIVSSGEKVTCELTLANGRTLRATPDHDILTESGWHPLGDLREGQQVVCEQPPQTGRKRKPKPHYRMIQGLRFHPYAMGVASKRRRGRNVEGWLARVPVHRLVAEARQNGIAVEALVDLCRTTPEVAEQWTFLDPDVYAVHHIDGNHLNNAPENLEVLTHTEHHIRHGQTDKLANLGYGLLEASPVKKVALYGLEPTFDIVCADPYRNFVANGIVVHNCGKTVVFSKIIDQRRCGRYMVIAHREELIRQAQAKIEAVTGERPEIEMAEERADEGGLLGRTRGVVASVQTLINRVKRFDPREFTTIIIDEAHHACFVAGTLIDGVPIEQLGIGDMVRSFNHNTGEIETRRITHTFKHRCRHLVVAKMSDGHRLICTPDHPILTHRGYVPAATLNPSDAVLYAKNTSDPSLSSVLTTLPNQEQPGHRRGGQVFPCVLLQGVQGEVVGRERPQDGHASMRAVRQDRHMQREARQRASARRSGVLLREVQNKPCPSDQPKDDGANQSCSCVASHENSQSDEATRNQGEGVQGDARAHISGQGRQWPADHASDDNGKCNRSGNGVSDSHRNGEGAVSVAANVLQSGPRRPQGKVSRRDRRPLASNQEVEVSRPTQDRRLEWVGVDRVEILEPGRDGRFGGLCPDGFVYNLEVEENHNYFANGFLVHNCAKSYRKAIKHFTDGNPEVKILGVTATPDRADEEALGQIFDVVAFNYEIHDAVRDGWLVPVRQRIVQVNSLDFADIKTTAGDFNQGQLAAVMEDEENLHKVASPVADFCGGKKTLIFATTVAQAERLAEILNRHDEGSARWVCGETPKDVRAQMFRDFRDGAFNRLCNVGVATEGYDEPGIECVVIARPTKSRSLYAQMVGRGTRPLPGLIDGPETADARRSAIADSAKPHVEVLDFAGNAGRHKLVSCADILGGKYTDEVVALADKKIAESAGMDVETALAEAAAEAKKQHEDARRREMEARRRVVSVADYSMQEVDPFDVLQIEPERLYGWDRVKRPSDRMVSMLASQGIDASRMKFGEASKLIGEILTRRERGLCSYAMAKALSRAGYPTDVSPSEATKMLVEIARKKREGAQV